MKKRIKMVKIKPPKNVSFKESTPLFSNKEIIFRSRGRAKVFNISPRLQVIFLSIVFGIALWSSYSYYEYNKSGSIISYQNKELEQTRDAYTDLISDFVAIHKNIGAMISSLDHNNVKNDQEIDNYKRHATVVEDKIKHITDEKKWLKENNIDEKTTISEAFLQRDVAVSERDILKQKVFELEKTIDELKNIESDLLDRVTAVADTEINKIKSSISTINSALKKKGQYYNALSGKKNSGKGGIYIQDSQYLNQNKTLLDKVSNVYEKYDDLEYYRDVAHSLPLGKPVWNYRVSSEFGHRSDPFNKKSAAHKGVDLASRKGNKVTVMAAGQVVRAEFVKGYGNLVEIDHGNGFTTKYAHLNKMYVKKGDKLNRKDVVGEVGSTGRSTGPHLHYEVLYRKVNVNPMAFINAGL